MTATASLPLYALADELRAVLEEVAENEGELTPELEERLNAAGGALDKKAERVALFIRETLLTAAAAETESKRLAARAKAGDRAAERLKKYLQDCMEATGTSVVKGALVTVRVQNNAPSVRVPEEPLLGTWPEAFVRVRVEEGPDKTALLEAHKRGETLPEGVTVVTTRSLRIV